MNQPLAVFRLSGDMARHAGQAQAQIARNIANADTPNYRAKTLEAFDPEIGRSGPYVEMAKTLPAHIARSDTMMSARLVDRGSEPSPNGNSVSLEEELLSSSEVMGDHRKALAIYGHALSVLRSAIGR